MLQAWGTEATGPNCHALSTGPARLGGEGGLEVNPATDTLSYIKYRLLRGVLPLPLSGAGLPIQSNQAIQVSEVSQGSEVNQVGHARGVGGYWRRP